MGKIHREGGGYLFFSLLFVGMDLATGVSGGVSAVSWFLSLFSLP